MLQIFSVTEKMTGCR